MEQQRARGSSRSGRRSRAVARPSGGTRGHVSHAAGEVAWIWDLETGRVARGGALQQICGLAVEEAGPDMAWWRDRIHPEDRAAVLAAYDAATSGERREMVLLYRFRRHDGSYALLLDRAFALGLDPEGPCRIVGFVREVETPRPSAGEGSPGAGGEQDTLPEVRPEVREDLESLSRRLVDSVEDERRRVSRELHDEVGQLLTSLRILLHSSSLDRAAADEILDELFSRVRDISTSLRPPMLDDLGLGPAISWHCQRFTARTGVGVNLMIRGLEHRLSPAIELAVFRVVQEALTNVARHSGATEAHVGIRGGRTHLECLVMDRGFGFDTRRTNPAASGLTGMRERIRAVGGRLYVNSVPGGGTRVSFLIRVPSVRAPKSSPAS